MVSGLQISMVIDGRTVTFNFARLAKITEIFEEGGSLGSFFRLLRDSPARVPNEGDTADLKVGGGVGLVQVVGGKMRPV